MHPPVEHYTVAGQCVQLGNLADAVSPHALAAAFARFDMLRVPDQTAHPVITREPLAANARLSSAERTRLHHATLARQASAAQMAPMCAAMAQVGPPRYHPEYMAKYGAYDSPQGTGRPIAPLANAEGQWKKLLEEFIDGPA